MVDEGPLTAAQIYEQINGGAGTGHLDAAQEANSRLRAQLLESAQLVGELAKQIQDGWTGEAGNAAANAARPLAKASLEDADLLSAADAAVINQASAFSTVKNRVVPVPPAKPEVTSADVVEAVVTGNWNGYNNKVGEWQARNQQNIDAFAGYHATSLDNGDTMPNAFTPLVDPGAPVSLAASAKDTAPTDSVGGGEPARNGSLQEQPPNQQTAQQTASSAQSGTKATAHQPFAPPADPSTPVHAKTPAAPKVPAGPKTPVTTPSASTPAGYAGTGTPAPLGGVHRTGAPGAPGPGLVDFGTGGKPGGAGARPGAPGAVPAPGRPVVANPGEMPRNATGRPLSSGAVPVGGAVPGARRSEEDEEHQRPVYLLGPDPEELFGGDTEKPVPPVIGEVPRSD